MPDEKTVTSQITDTVTQANVKVLDDASAQAIATLYQVTAHTVGLSMQNATSAQQEMRIIQQAITTQCINSIISFEPAASARTSQQIMTDNDIASLIATLNAALNSNKQASEVTG